MGKEPNIPTESVGTYQEAYNGQVDVNSVEGSTQVIITADECVDVQLQNMDPDYVAPPPMGIVE